MAMLEGGFSVVDGFNIYLAVGRGLSSSYPTESRRLTRVRKKHDS